MRMREFIERVKQASNNPVELSRLHLELAYEYARLSQDYEEYLPAINQTKRNLMVEHKTVSKAEQAFDLSTEGEKEKAIRIRLKSMEKLLSGLKRRVETYENEARNQF
ncbi:MAG: hypothetical protein NVSMB66_6430 [Candidatus Doudnabacteria bacterium]